MNLKGMSHRSLSRSQVHCLGSIDQFVYGEGKINERCPRQFGQIALLMLVQDFPESFHAGAMHS